MRSAGRRYKGDELTCCRSEQDDSKRRSLPEREQPKGGQRQAEVEAGTDGGSEHGVLESGEQNADHSGIDAVHRRPYRRLAAEYVPERQRA